ncbi:hypothetical protein DPMN_160490 [Dreissena polymorpha]|uniref:Uncharacterized protein n=2 Tax=Dreissena polymorpha TaxID=45954 RepID=A0A9D4EMX7_DREPO|nr:hypothetical protein DPMN_160490 [Dreissena polymorpha]
MASLALCGIMPGMIVASEDKMMFNRSFEQGFAQNANAKHDSPKPNKATSNSDGVTVSEPSGLFKHHTIPVFNLDNMNESGDEDDNEGPLNLDTGNNSSVSTYILGSTFKTLHHSIQSDTGHSILIISSESHASQKRASVGNKEMQPLLEHQTSEDSDEYGGTVDHEVDHIEPFNNSNISKASYTVLNDIV